eukprot:TRINITY_DN14579_c0_g1_i1.p1 TRINITY_DN14579_c0_g1~~TRINITY_DN14579_c0_g1_i1.p1  ORF type:complete len:260 (+),score=50.12 TRINITY_DN14579_c0_g1_i1:158-937(+)
MDTRLTYAIGKCYREKDVFCMIISPLTLAATLVPPLIVIYALCRHAERKSIVYSSAGFLYGLIAFQSIGIMEVATQFDTMDYVLFCIGLVNAALFTVAFVIDFLKKFLQLTSSWKLARLVFGLITCIFCIFASTVKIGSAAFYLTLLLTFATAIFAGALTFTAVLKLTRDSIPINFLISSVIAYGMWNALALKLVINNEGFTVGSTLGLVVLAVGFVLQVTYCVAYLIARSREGVKGSLFYDLEKGFGENIKANATAYE